MLKEVKESLPEQTKTALFKYLAAGAPGMTQGDRIEVVRRYRESVFGGWVKSDPVAVEVETPRDGIVPVPLPEVQTIKRWQPADNLWPGCWCQTDSSICGMLTLCSMTRSRGMQA